MASRDDSPDQSAAKGPGVRGASLSTETVELGFWAVVAQMPVAASKAHAEDSSRADGEEPAAGLSASPESSAVAAPEPGALATPAPEASHSVREEGEQGEPGPIAVKAAAEAEERPSEAAVKQILQRFPEAEALLEQALRTKVAVRSGRQQTAVSLAHYEKRRAALAATSSGSEAVAGRAAWPPGAQTIAARFGGGSWAAATQALGVKTQSLGRARGSGQLTAEDFRRALADFRRHCESQGENPTYAAYGRWAAAERKAGRPRPSGPTIRQRYGKWSTAMEATA